MYLTIVFLTFVSSLTVGFFGRFFGFYGSALLSTSCLILAFFCSVFIFYEVAFLGCFSYVKLVSWMSSETLNVDWGFMFDSITAVMCCVVTFISCLVHLYSTEYMSHDPHLPRFMSYLSLFTFFMLILVTADNFIQMFVGWEGVGLCSYLLINFWFTRIQANKAAIKAMLMNRIGDFSLIIGIIIIFIYYKAVDYASVAVLTPFVKEDVINFLNLNVSLLTVIGIFLFIGAVGKSAQLGLHTWLPDAMEGPALAHFPEKTPRGNVGRLGEPVNFFFARLSMAAQTGDLVKEASSGGLPWQFTLIAVGTVAILQMLRRDRNVPNEEGEVPADLEDQQGLPGTILNRDQTDIVSNVKSVEELIEGITSFPELLQFVRYDHFKITNLYSENYARFLSLTEQLEAKIFQLLSNEFGLNTLGEGTLTNLTNYQNWDSLLTVFTSSETVKGAFAKMLSQLQNLSGVEIYYKLVPNYMRLVEVATNEANCNLNVLEYSLCSSFHQISQLGFSCAETVVIVIAVYSLDFTYSGHIPTLFDSVGAANSLGELGYYDVGGNRSRKHYKILFEKISELFRAEYDVNDLTELNHADRILFKLGRMRDGGYAQFYAWLIDAVNYQEGEQRCAALKRLISELINNDGDRTSLYDRYLHLFLDYEGVDPNLIDDWSYFERAFFQHIAAAGIGFFTWCQVAKIFLLFLAQG